MKKLLSVFMIIYLVMFSGCADKNRMIVNEPQPLKVRCEPKTLRARQTMVCVCEYPYKAEFRWFFGYADVLSQKDNWIILAPLEDGIFSVTCVVEVIETYTDESGKRLEYIKRWRGSDSVYVVP